MKQIQVCTLAAALALLACGKTPNTPVEPGKDINSVEIENESVPVPIELGSGTVTKAAMIDDDVFFDDDFRFRVLAIDVDALSTDTNKVLLNGVEAGNKKPNGKDYYVTDFTGGARYYPLISKNNYTFFGYRTNEDNTSGLDNNYNVNNIALGYSDLIWAKAQATELPEIAGFTQYQGYKGFNAKYIRAIRAIAGAGDYLAGNDSYAPKLRFNHITSALSFKVKAADEAAEESLEDIATLTGITLKNVKTTANLAVVPNGTLSTTAEAGELVVKDENGNNPAATAFVENPVFNFGAPLFILPSAIDNPYLNNGDGYSVVLSLNVNNQAMTLDPIKLTLPDNGFEAGKHYTFTISINSLEEIVIVTELTPWADGGSTEEIVIE